jgi:hypothetical protein
MDGWVNVEAPLPQEWITRLILRMDDGSIVVRDLQVARGYGQLEFTTAGVDEVILAIAGATEGTNNLAPYTVDLERR